MKVFVATRRGQGRRRDDFFWGVEGELVMMPIMACANPRCGCDRSVSGLASSKASTTFISIERPELDLDSYRTVFLDALQRQGWIPPGAKTSEFDDFIEWHIALAAQVTPNVVLRARAESDGSTVEVYTDGQR